MQTLEFAERTWVEYNATDATGARNSLRQELGMESGLRMQIILTEAIKVNQSIEREERRAEEDRKEHRQMGLMNASLSTSPIEGSRDSEATSPEKPSAERGIDRFRVDLCPKIPIYAQVDEFFYLIVTFIGLT
jgi:hypothetical protein